MKVDEVLKMKDPSRLAISGGEESALVFYRLNDRLVVFEVPIYGGEEVYLETLKWNDRAAISKVFEEWT